MKRTHLVLLIVTAIVTMYSAYSLAELSHTNYLEFEWYYDYYKSYSNQIRSEWDDNWKLDELAKDINFIMISRMEELQNFSYADEKISELYFEKEFFKEYFVLYLNMGKRYSSEYSIRILDMAQRGNILEVRVSLNSPKKQDVYESFGFIEYEPYDIVRIKRVELEKKGKIKIIFKDQDNNKLFENNYNIN